MSSVQFSHSVLSNCLWPHGQQHVRPPCPSPTHTVYSDLSPLSQWCHPTISSSVTPFSSCLHSFPASGSFSMSQLFSSGGQSIGASASASVLPVNIQGWFPLGWTGWISLQSKDLSRVFSNTTVQTHRFFSPQKTGKQIISKTICAVQLSCSVMSDSLRPHGLQHTRLPCPSPTPEAYSDSLLPSTFPSIRVCSNEPVLRIRWPEYWSFSFNINPSNAYWGLISFRMDWLNPLAVQGILKSLIQHHSSKASILWCSALFIVIWGEQS